ncbi:hypothetical protein IE81DRAFT_329096 [Ceraceosorus guamensis]|uniref:Uncharacterized protein n=1 Tax=Ceraceosorus guamensis TaxID=1522189 RepID=A0A316W205_9BASI|nr:hypothetical protein IE81DRAFT_329096 [Ceraceosorus guamensis]PWN43896.1 hypothetical protein IE81DRAFT_329096 [Ceraceosorus guamensis]
MRRRSIWLIALACAAILCTKPTLAREEATVNFQPRDVLAARQASSQSEALGSTSGSLSALPSEATQGITFVPSSTLSNGSSISTLGSGEATSTILYPTSSSDGSDEDSVAQLPTGVSRMEGQPTPTSPGQPHDPLLAIMPDFAFSMPAQIVANGINLALVTILGIHLLFTAQYHYPLSSRNYLLQAVSTAMLLISLSVQLNIVLRKLHHQSHTWPYMFAYIGVQIPPQDGTWTTVQEAFFLLMRACTTALAHLTHIQFLTLLFPSALEARLILWMLGPLALAASGMEFTALSSSDDVKTSDLGDAIRNICNSTLTLLYTSALLIWGLLVNRRRAWRTDGGTAAFGGGSVGLAIINTAISFVEIAFDRVWWLPDMCWTLTIWQSWLGFWWWVGSGMGIGEVEDRVERQERLRKREERIKRKRDREERHRRKAEAAAATAAANGTEAGSGADGDTALMGHVRRFKDKMVGETNARLRRPHHGSSSEPNEEIELEGVSGNEARNAAERRHSPEADLRGVEVHDEARNGPPGTVVGSNNPADDALTTAGSSSDTHPTSTSAPGWFQPLGQALISYTPSWITRRYNRLRRAHEVAARRAATEQSVLRDQMLHASRSTNGPGLRHMMFDPRIERRIGMDEGEARRSNSARRSATQVRHVPALGLDGHAGAVNLSAEATESMGRDSSGTLSGEGTGNATSTDQRTSSSGSRNRDTPQASPTMTFREVGQTASARSLSREQSRSRTRSAHHRSTPPSGMAQEARSTTATTGGSENPFSTPRVEVRGAGARPHDGDWLDEGPVIISGGGRADDDDEPPASLAGGPSGRERQLAESQASATPRHDSTRGDPGTSPRWAFANSIRQLRRTDRSHYP